MTADGRLQLSPIIAHARPMDSHGPIFPTYHASTQLLSFEFGALSDTGKQLRYDSYTTHASVLVHVDATDTRRKARKTRQRSVQMMVIQVNRSQEPSAAGVTPLLGQSRLICLQRQSVNQSLPPRYKLERTLQNHTCSTRGAAAGGTLWRCDPAP